MAENLNECLTVETSKCLFRYALKKLEKMLYAKIEGIDIFYLYEVYRLHLIVVIHTNRGLYAIYIHNIDTITGEYNVKIPMILLPMRFPRAGIEIGYKKLYYGLMGILSIVFNAQILNGTLDIRFVCQNISKEELDTIKAHWEHLTYLEIK